MILIVTQNDMKINSFLIVQAMISSKMGTSFFDTVPEMNEFDFDLGTMDTFEDFDINMTCADMMGDTAADPFGDFSLEKSFDLIELNKVFQRQDSGYSGNGHSNSEALLEDFDCEETLKQDIMWSAHSVNNQIRSVSTSRLQSTATSTPTKLSLTPPSSYISQMFHDSPLSSSSDDDTDTSGDQSPGPRGHCMVTASDHCYTTLNTSSELLTPPESSEDEDYNSFSLPSSPSIGCNNVSKSRKTSRLSTIENDRLNKKSLLKSSLSVHHKNTTTADKPKFIFSVRMKKGSRSLPPALHRRSKVSRRDKKSSRLTTISSYKTLKENERGVLFSPTNRQTIKVPCVNEKILKQQNGEKLSNRDARNVHNQMERQRRSDLNQAYATLKDFVPAIANSDRASKQMVLDKAIEHCQTLKSREEVAAEQRRKLGQRNEALRRKLELLQSELRINTNPQSTQELDDAHWEIQGW